MKKYDKYKHSGVEWIGEIPEQWEVEKLRFIGRFTASGIDKKINEDEPLVKIINYTDVYGNSSLILDTNRNYMEVSCPEQKRIEHQVKKGDLIFTPSSETIVDIGLSALVDENLENTAYSYHVLRFRFEMDIDHSFKKYLCNNHFVLNQFSANAKGTTRQILNRENFNSTLVILPPLAEQTAIANYLDEKTAKIDALIEKKKKLLELYKEERTAVINQAVTRGIDPNVKLKPSGIEWLGEIPEHWEVKSLTRGLESIADYRGKTPKKGSKGIFLVTARNIKNGKIDYSLSEEYADPEEAQAILKRGKPEIGDVLFTTEAPLGEVANIDRGDIALAQRIIKFRGKKNETDNYYLKYWIISHLFQQNLKSHATGSTALGIKASKLHLLKLILPPIEEQHQIVHHIETETKRIDEKIAKTEKLIELLQEYRTALISEVVTGKIKVV